jgi:hypothetical protein
MGWDGHVPMQRGDCVGSAACQSVRPERVSGNFCSKSRADRRVCYPHVVSRNAAFRASASHSARGRLRV